MYVRRSANKTHLHRSENFPWVNKHLARRLASFFVDGSSRGWAHWRPVFLCFRIPETMNRPCRSISLIFVVVFIAFSIQQIFPPTRPIDLWNPFGTTTTRHPGEVPLKNKGPIHFFRKQERMKSSLDFPLETLLGKNTSSTTFPGPPTVTRRNRSPKAS